MQTCQILKILNFIFHIRQILTNFGANRHISESEGPPTEACSSVKGQEMG